MKRIVIAAGCFWGVEAYYSRLKGVAETNVGYVNGNIDNPRYEDLITKKATHAESCAIVYDENIITLNDILNHMFRIIDPTSLNKQGGDIGIQYRSGIYYKLEEDGHIARKFIWEAQKRYEKRIVVEVEKEKHFFPAEDYHQNYLSKNPEGYCHVDLHVMNENEKK